MIPAELPSLSAIQDTLNRADRARLAPLRLSVLRNIMVEPIEPYLRYLALDSGLDATIAFGEYDHIVQEALADGGPIASETEAVLVFCSLENASPLLARGYAAAAPEAIAAECDRLVEMARAVVDGIRRRTTAMILWHGFEAPTHPALGILDAQSPNGQRATVQGLNARLREVLAQAGGAYLVDMDSLVARVGAREFHDRRYWHIGKAPYTRRALAEIAAEDMKFFRALKGRARKCLVADCDNTLWGGIVGEDGIEGIRIGPTHPGSAYLELQSEILQLHSRGVILALCSKNNEGEVLEVLRNHPDMLLREKHLSAARINWQDKAANLREIAAELNIGLDSMVFMDDNPFEIELVRRELPQVATLLLPDGQAVQYRDLLASCGLFETLSLSAEDRRRGEMYRANAERERIRATATDLGEYLQALKMHLEIRRADAFSVPRIAQLTQKTNQFNLTTRRYGEAEIAAMTRDPRCDVLYAKLSDRLGDYGIIGVCILRRDNGLAKIDTFLVSCRALGRGVECAMLRESMRLARLRGATRLIGEYIPTVKNRQTADFYSRASFARANQAGSAAESYEFQLCEQPPEIPAEFAHIVTNF